MGTGMIVIMSTIILIKLRGFGEDIPIPPVIMFIILIFIAFYSSYNSNKGEENETWIGSDMYRYNNTQFEGLGSFA